MTVSGFALGCRFSMPKPFRESLAAADQVYVFRLDTLTAQKDTLYWEDAKGNPKQEERYMGRVVGRITVVRALRGKPAARFVTFDNSMCGGVRLDVGHYFLVATSQSNPVLQLAPSDQSVLDLQDGYADGDSHNDNGRVLAPVLAFLKGKPLPKDFPSRDQTAYTNTGILPPPPPRKSP
jgi:hypothetical protein